MSSSAAPTGSISFGDGAEDAFVRVASTLPVGYTVALLPEGEPIPTDSGIGPFDVSLVEGSDVDGVRCRRIDPQSEEEIGPEVTVPWQNIAHIHVY